MPYDFQSGQWQETGGGIFNSTTGRAMEGRSTSSTSADLKNLFGNNSDDQGLFYSEF
jgi:hypothetical protein